MADESSISDTDFRMEAREWLEMNKPRDKRPLEDFAAVQAFDSEWQRRQFDGGWAGISWPKVYGGLGLPVLRQMIWYEEYARAGCPHVIDACWLGLNHAGPTLIAKATEELKSFHLPAILRGEKIWSQGFSEPNAGSDLASLRTRGVIDGDELVITGQKTWTSYAHLSDYQELLIRTDPKTSRHTGLTWIIGDMNAPGIDVRPIRSMTGEFHNCEVFYDEVRLPLTNVVGRIGEGWSVAMATLGYERGTAGFGEACQIAMMVEEMIEFARETTGADGRPILSDESFSLELAQARAEARGLRALNHLTMSRIQSGAVPGNEASIVRLFQTELEKRVGRLAMDLLGQGGVDRGVNTRWAHFFLFSFAQTIAGGSAEIQRNIIGERVLGLPR